ncbi:glycosyltransferase family 87 protein [Alisedimentitalea sp. MJ-SS2]|uniref:glycosyltransferase family 87 protein n=1 Tax=Aliisedimentitalea sp. MJ-SS2 TaxID=3049795 RepID=UPI002913A465|nr:glycosyltransferase family 87 protein [Alisedimentitalea sp. MJ-SS2]MDU8927330.1 glycosyltransferase family 87 protein [Alisedimentitalea sp. MJ-SS2]
MTQTRVILIGGALATLVLAFIGQYAPSRDLLALWLAADAVASGNPSQIFPPLGDTFAMRPPPGWYERAAELDQLGEVYPYIYPPIWAWLMAPLTKIMSFETFRAGAFALNAGLLCATSYLAARLAGVHPGSPSTLRNWMLVALALILVSQAGTIALRQGQVQILVAFLSVLALERAQRHHPKTAGIAMGIAIALKLSPLLLALLWLVTGHWRAFLWAMVVGGALGLASLIVAGWPLHAHFLALLGAIDQTVLITTVTYALDTLIGGWSLLGAPQMIPIVPPEMLTPELTAALEEPSANWLVLPKPALYAMIARGAVLATLILSAFLLRRAASPEAAAAAWATAMTGIAFFGPIGWAYYYIAPFAFAPLFLNRFGIAGGIALLGAIGLCYVNPVKQMLWSTLGLSPMQSIGLATLLYLCLMVFTSLSPTSRKSDDDPDPIR